MDPWQGEIPLTLLIASDSHVTRKVGAVAMKEFGAWLNAYPCRSINGHREHHVVAFALIGAPVLDYLQVSMPAFRIAGGLLLFLQALTLTFSSPGLASIDDRERRDAEAPGDIAVFPLAFPVSAGPGTL